MAKPSNEEIAGVLERIADLLEAQDANTFRIQAYRKGANTVRSADESIADVVHEEGQESLQELPDVGDALAGLIAEYVRTGRSDLLNRLRGEVSPVQIFTQVPGIDEELARNVADELDVNSLEALEQAAHDGRLEEVTGFDEKKVRDVRVSIAGLLSGAAQRRMRRVAQGGEGNGKEPPVSMLLDVDAEYRRKAEAGKLKKIAPKRFNPENEAWLPILHTERGDWSFTALYSNTARAHELGTTHDWVVIYYDRGGREDQATVVRETDGPLEGKRVVRGREAESREYYEK